MAKSNGILKIEGTVENLTFYEKDGKTFVRAKGGVSKERIMNDPSFIRTRENGSEFSLSAHSGKLLRDSLGTMVFKAKDSKLSARLMQTMSRIKNLDTVSARGNRHVGNGIGTPEGRQLLEGFDFNANAPLHSVLHADYEFIESEGTVYFEELLPAEQLLFPKGATHFSMQSAFLRVDFGAEVFDIAYSPIVNLPIDHELHEVKLTPTAVPAVMKTSIHLLMISFFQEVNGVQYSLRNESYNVLNVIRVK